MIDHPATVARLVVQMGNQFPIPAFPTKDVVRTLRRRGVQASANRALSVMRVFYAGDEDGIVCDVTPSRAAKEVLSVSLTHLRSLRSILYSRPSWRISVSESGALPPWTRERSAAQCRRQRTISTDSHRTWSPEF